MADYAIFPGAMDGGHLSMQQSPIIAIDDDELLFIYTDSPGVVGLNGTSDGGGDDKAGTFCWRSTDGGVTYSAVGVILAEDFPLGFCAGAAVWYDKWTPNYTANSNVHISQSARNIGNTFGTHYTALNTVGAIVNGPITLEDVFDAESVGDGDNTGDDRHGIVRLANGDIFIVMFGNGDPDGTDPQGDYLWVYKGTGGTFTTHQSHIAHISLEDLGGTFDFEEVIEFYLMPSPNAGQFFLIIAGKTANDSDAAMRVYEWNGSTFVFGGDIDTNVSKNIGDSHKILSMAIRHRDHRIFVAYLTVDDASIKLAYIDTNNTFGVVPGEIVLEGVDDLLSPALMCVQSNGHLYCGYLKGAIIGDNMDVFYKRTPNGGVDWEAQVTFWETGSGLALVRCDLPMSTPGESAGVFQIIWYDTTDNTWHTNDTNMLVVGDYRVHLDGPGSDQVDCQIGMAMAGTDKLGLKRGYQNYQGSHRQVILSLGSTKRGSIAVGDLVIGATSGATGVFSGWDEDLNRILIGDVRVGSKSRSDTPFLPNETIHVVGDDSKTVTVAAAPSATFSVAIDIPAIDT